MGQKRLLLLVMSVVALLLFFSYFSYDITWVSVEGGYHETVLDGLAQQANYMFILLHRYSSVCSRLTVIFSFMRPHLVS